MTLGLLFLFLFLLSAAPHPPSPDCGQQHGYLFRDKAHTIDGTGINIDTHQMPERRTCQACLSIYAECRLSSAQIRKILLLEARTDVEITLIIDYGLNNVKITGDIPPAVVMC